jgi:hypothetical protein
MDNTDRTFIEELNCPCNGFSNQLSQFKNGEITLTAGLTQALQDVTNPHLYLANPLRRPCRIVQVAVASCQMHSLWLSHKNMEKQSTRRILRMALTVDWAG